MDVVLKPSRMMERKIPKVHLDTDGMAPPQRLAGWRAAVPGYDMTVAEDVAVESFEAEVDLWDFGATSLLYSRITPAHMQRTKAHLADGNDSFTFLFMKDGGWTGTMDGRPMAVGAGQLLGFDYSKPVDMAGHSADSVSLTVSRALMDALTPRRPEVHGLMFDSAPARLLSDHLISLAQHMPSIDESDLAGVDNATLNLLGICLGNASRAGIAQHVASSARVRQQVMRFIDENLMSPDLTPDRISDELGYSRSVIYRSFETSMGVASYIRRRRLDVAHKLLTTPGQQRKISDVAAQLNFVSEAHFSRVFRQAFGYSPRNARRKLDE